MIKMSGFILIMLLAQLKANAWNELREYQTGQWDFRFKTNYYQALANFTRVGNEFESLDSGSNYSVTDFDFGTRWNPARGIGVYADARIAYAQSTSALGVSRTNSTFNHLRLGGDWVLWSGPGYQWIPDLSLTYPFTRVDVNDDSVLTGEGAIEISAQLLGRFSWGRFTPYASGGFIYRDEGRSSLIPFAAGLSFYVMESTMGAELRGYLSATRDQYSSNPIQRETVGPRNGGAMRFYAVNPALMDANFWWKTGFQREWELELGGGFSMTGASTSSGFQVYAVLNYFLTTRPKHSPQKPLLERFQEQTNDGVDQSLFQAPPPPPGIQQEPIASPPPKKKTQKSIEQELQETEMQLELRKIDDPNTRR